jgi:hypothetical protein
MNRGDCLFDAFIVAGVCDKAFHGSARLMRDLGRARFERSSIARHERHVGAFTGERAGDRLADPAAAAADDGDFIDKLKIHGVFSFVRGEHRETRGLSREPAYSENSKYPVGYRPRYIV